MSVSLSRLFEIASQLGLSEIEIDKDFLFRSNHKYYAFLRCLGVWTPSYFCDWRKLEERITSAGFVSVVPAYISQGG